VAFWRTLSSDADAKFDRVVEIDAAAIAPCITWGTSPGMVVPVTGRVPDPAEVTGEAERRAAQRALEYMKLEPSTKIADVAIDRVFIGSCTNSRLEDLRAAARVVKGHRAVVPAWIVPGSGLVKRAAEAEGRDRGFVEAGFAWRAGGWAACGGGWGRTAGGGVAG